MVHTGERCCKEWNDLVRVARKKTSAIAADQRRTGGGSPTQEPLTENEIRALSLVRDSNYATTGIGADPPIQDDSEDSNQTSAERPDDRSTASTSAVTQPSPDFTPARDDEEKEEEEEEEPLILEPVEVEVGVETEKDITVPCGTAGTSSTTDSIFRGFPHASSYSVGPSGVQQGAPSVAVPLPQRWRLVQKRSIAARQIGAYQDMVHLSQASVDKGRELLKAMATIARNISAQSERQSEEMSRLITAMEQTADSVDAMRQSPGSGHSLESPRAIIVGSTAPEGGELPPASSPEKPCLPDHELLLWPHSLRLQFLTPSDSNSTRGALLHTGLVPPQGGPGSGAVGNGRVGVRKGGGR